MKFLSLFSGIEAASLAWEPLGWECMAVCENDEFPAAVLAARWPDVENLGDITKVNWGDFIERSGRPDVILGGSPCQSFSIAGGRESLDGESRLMYEYIRACAEVRSPWIVWENVVGALNTKDNAFGQLLGSLQDIGYVSLAWRVLDAQFFGVAQRRRRVFLVGHLGDGGSAAAVLLEPEGMCGDTKTSREKREELAADARRRASASRGEGVAFSQNTREEVRLIGGNGDHVGAIAGRPDSKGQGRSLICQTVTMAHGQANAEVCEDGLVPTLTRIHEAPIVAREQDP